MIKCLLNAPQEVQSDRAKAVTLSNTAEETKLVFNNITKAQQGTYVVTATNVSGSDSAKVTVTVLERSTPPEENKKDAIELLWKRSRDDGGAPIEYYQVHAIL